MNESLNDQIVGGMFFEVPSLLATSEWQTVPWKTQKKTDFHKLFDDLALLPTLLRASRGIRTTEQNVWFDQLYGQVDASLDAWLDYLTAKGNAHSNVSSAAGELHSCDLTHVQMMTLCWEAKLLCYKAVKRVTPQVPSRQFEGYADNICSACKFMQLDEFGIIGMQFSIMPALIARAFYEDGGFVEKLRMCDESLGKLARRPFSFLSVYK